MELKGHFEHTAKHIRVLYNKVYIADTISAQLVWEHNYHPEIYIPLKDVKEKYLSELDHPKQAPSSVKHQSKVLKLTVDGKSTDAVVQIVAGPLKNYIRFHFSEMDGWFEEDTPMHVHMKDPYKRIEALPSTRHIVVKIGGTIVAETKMPTILFEPLSPTRYYMPQTAIKWEYIEESSRITKCPYKGDANYYSVIINGKKYPDVIWWYKYPAAESLGIIGLACFYNEKVDIYVDGVLEGSA